MYRKQFVRGALVSLGAALLFGGTNNKPAASQSFDLGAFQNSALAEHNAYRSDHRSPALTLGTSLNSTAQAHAEAMLSRGNLFHSSSNQRNGAGENLFVSYSPSPLAPEAIAAQTIGTWYEEESNYNYGNPGFDVNAGHFTQIVWKDTTQLGCGVAQGSRNFGGRDFTAYYVVCHYAPAGNVVGEFPSNVLQP